jgi:tetratricopeptide (TPR) repeat protein
LAAGPDQESAREFAAACDQDVLRFRADSRINDLLRAAATHRQPEGVTLVDAEALMNARSSHGSAGDEYLYEHVHLNFEGNYLVARALAEAIGQSLPSPQPGGADWPTLDACARRLGWNDFTRRASEIEILSRLGHAPFKEQTSNPGERQRLVRQIEQLQTAALPDYLRAELARAETACAVSPNDWMLHKNLARLQEETGNLAGAVTAWQQVVRGCPHNPDAWESLGLALAASRRDEEAAAAFQQTTRLHPESVAGRNSLGELYAREGRWPQAEQEFQAVLKLKPYWGPAHLGLGKALEARHQLPAAEAEFKAALQYRVSSPESYKTLAQFAFSRGWYDAAATNFTDSLRLYPADPETQVNLGLVLVKLGKHTEAREHYTEALRLRPRFAEAHFCLGLELGQAGDAPAAAAEFAEAVRLKPELIEARLNLGVALASQQLNQQALEQFEEVLRRDPNNPVARGRVQALRAGLPPPGPAR